MIGKFEDKPRLGILKDYKPHLQEKYLYSIEVVDTQYICYLFS